MLSDKAIMTRILFVGLKRTVLIEPPYIIAELPPALVKGIKVDFGYVSTISYDFYVMYARIFSAI